jgi:hypothetical protein
MPALTPPLLPPVRRGSAYIAILGVSLLVITLGLGGLLASRSTRMTMSLESDQSEARAYAFGAIDWIRRSMSLDAAWRSKLVSGATAAPMTFGRGTIAYRLVDEVDGDLANEALDPVRVYGFGYAGEAARGLSVELKPTGPGLGVLGVPLYGAGATSTANSVVVDGGPLACGGLLTVNGGSIVAGNVECGTLVNLGTITGTTTTGAAARPMPPGALVHSTWQAKATTIPYASIASATIDSVLLSAGSNPWGAPSAAGVYFIDVPSAQTLTIRRSRLACTLVVDLRINARLTISGANHVEPHGPGMPTLVIRGGIGSRFEISGSLSPLVESSIGVNLNPAGSPHNGETDGDTADSYPSLVRGLVYVSGSSVSTVLSSNAYIFGSVIAEGTLSVSNTRVTADPSLLAAPPEMFIQPTGLAPVPTTWRREPVD